MLPVDPLVLLAFIPAGLALNLTPGADMMFCLGQGLRSGPGAAMAANVGIAVGGMVHTLAAALGLGALLAAHPAAFDVIRWAGVAYLLWLAARGLRAGGGLVANGRGALSMGRAFREAFLVNLLNPKVILFILAFLPQFVDPTGPVFAQFITLGLVFAAGGLLVNGVVGVFAGRLGRELATSPIFALWLGRVSAGIFTMLALRLAIMER